MPKKKSAPKFLVQLLPWSYSKLSAWEKCPAVVKFRYIDRIQGEKSRALIRGNEMHERLEKWVRGGAPKKNAPVEGLPFVDYVRPMIEEAEAWTGDRAAPPSIVIEEMWRHAPDWRPVEPGSPREWVRVKLDLCLPSQRLVIDWKSGKRYPENHRDQAKIYAAAFLARYPEAPDVTVDFVYTDLKELGSLTVGREHLPQIHANTSERVAAMVADEEFKPRPSRLCAWCDYSRTKGGPCKAG